MVVTRVFQVRKFQGISLEINQNVKLSGSEICITLEYFEEATNLNVLTFFDVRIVKPSPSSH